MILITVNGKAGVKMGIAGILRDMMIGRWFTTENGRIKMFSSKMDWTLYPSKALAHFFQTIGEKLGEDYLFMLSYINGRRNGEEMVKSMGLKPMGGWITTKAIINLLEFLGYGKLEFIVSKIGAGGHHHIIIHSSENPIVEHGVRMYGRKQMSCTYWRGLLSGHAEIELGCKNVRAKENKCIAEGSKYCIYEAKW